VAVGDGNDGSRFVAQVMQYYFVVRSQNATKELGEPNIVLHQVAVHRTILSGRGCGPFFELSGYAMREKKVKGRMRDSNHMRNVHFIGGADVLKSFKIVRRAAVNA
jgi:hypothetical protein